MKKPIGIKAEAAEAAESGKSMSLTLPDLGISSNPAGGSVGGSPTVFGNNISKNSLTNNLTSTNTLKTAAATSYPCWSESTVGGVSVNGKKWYNKLWSSTGNSWNPSFYTGQTTCTMRYQTSYNGGTNFPEDTGYVACSSGKTLSPKLTKFNNNISQLEFMGQLKGGSANYSSKQWFDTTVPSINWGPVMRNDTGTDAYRSGDGTYWYKKGDVVRIIACFHEGKSGNGCGLHISSILAWTPKHSGFSINYNQYNNQASATMNTGYFYNSWTAAKSSDSGLYDAQEIARIRTCAEDRYNVYLQADNNLGTKLTANAMGYATPVWFGVDGTAPTVSYSSLSSSGQVTVTPSDSMSGVSKYQYRISRDNGSTWDSWVLVSSGSPSGISLPKGSDIVQTQATDNVGNVSTVNSNEYDIAHVGPVISANNQTDWASTNKVSVDISDMQSAVRVEKYAFGDEPISYFASNGTTLTNNSFTTAQNGVYTVYAKDDAGNESIANVTVDHVLILPSIDAYTSSVTDLSVNSTGINVSFARNYDSSNSSVGVLGKGWTFGYEGSCKDYQYTYKDESGTAKTATLAGLKEVKLPDGSTYYYTLNNGQYTSYNNRDTLTQGTDGTFSLTTKDSKATYHFNANGYLDSIKDRNGNVESISVDSSGNVTGLTDTVGRKYTITYTNGKITSIADPINRTVTYGYTGDELTSVTNPMGNVTTYTYDTSGYLNQISDSNGKVTWKGTYSTDTANHPGRLMSETDGDNKTTTYAYDDSGNSVTQTDSDNKQTITQYDSLNRVTQTQEPNDDGTTDTTSYVYANSYGDLQSQTDSSGTTQYVYDDNGNQTSVIKPDGTDTYTYDSNGNCLTEKTAAGKMTYHQYDSNGNLTLTASPKNGTDEYSSSADQSLFDITKYEYVSNGLVIKETDPDGTITTNTYDGSGNVLTQNNSKTGTTTFTYNAIGWVTAKTTPSGKHTAYVYDNDGKMIKATGNNGVTRYVYTDGKLTQQIDPSEYDSSKDGLNQSTPVNTYGDSNVGYRYTYNGSGTLTKETLPNNQVLNFNDDGKVVSEQTAGAAVTSVNYTYDDNDNIKTINENVAQKVRYAYDDSNQLTREDNVWLNQTVTYEYDAVGNLVSKNIYPYTTNDDLSAATPTDTVSYQYTNDNDKDQLTAFDGKEITYDSDGNTLSFDGWNFTWQNKQLAGAAKGSNTISYQYNNSKIRTSKTVLPRQTEPIRSTIPMIPMGNSSS